MALGPLGFIAGSGFRVYCDQVAVQSLGAQGPGLRACMGGLIWEFPKIEDPTIAP